MDQFGNNNLYLTKNEEPWFPIMGEIHYSRVRREDWYPELLKMKSGGIEVVATYVIWIHHEEKENQCDFSGNNDLNYFISLCKKAGLYLFLRIGPWCHAEARNGGFPDWLLKKPFQARSNDEQYFNAVGKFYTAIFSEVKNHLHGKGGPIIGVQIENEFGHAGGLSGEPGQQHMRTLTEIARQTGFDVPYYTATGWGGACTGGLQPVFAGYCDTPWDRSTEVLGANDNYNFSDNRDDELIANDYVSGKSKDTKHLNQDYRDYPYLTAELGAGLQVTDHRRPLASGQDIEAMILAKLGSGANLLGYYMYHGGTNPVGELSTFQESKDTGSPNDYAIYSYDFQAPVGEFGQLRESYHRLRHIHTILNLFGKQIAKMKTVIISKRCSIRYDISGSTIFGFLFINNYQRNYSLPDMMAEKHSFRIEKYEVTLSVQHIKKGEYGILPVFGELTEHSETALHLGNVMPLFRDSERVWGYQPFSSCTTPESSQFLERFFSILRNKDDKQNPVKDIVLIPKSAAVSLYRISLKGKDYYIIHSGGIITDDESLVFTSRKPVIEVGFQPKPDFLIADTTPDINGFHSCILGSAEKDPVPMEISITEISAEDPENNKRFSITLKYGNQDYRSIENIYLLINFFGDKADISMNDKLVHDFLYTGKPYEFGLKQYGYPKELLLEITALDKNKKVYLEIPPRFTGSKALGLESVSSVIVHRIKVL